MFAVRGHKAAAKFEPPKVFIRERLKAQLREIFHRKPHVSATNAHREVISDPTHANNNLGVAILSAAIIDWLHLGFLHHWFRHP